MASNFIANGNKKNPTPLPDNVVKIVMVGEAKCGKTTLIRAYYDHNRPREISSQNGVRIYRCFYEGPKHILPVAIIDIPSDPEFLPEQRFPFYKSENIIVFLHAVDDPSSFKSLATNWLPEIDHYLFNMRRKHAIVGTKADLRNNKQVEERLAEANETFVNEDDVRSEFGLDSLVLNCSGKNEQDAIRTFKEIIEHFLSDR